MICLKWSGSNGVFMLKAIASIVEVKVHINSLKACRIVPSYILHKLRLIEDIFKVIILVVWTFSL